mgnify:CR=1 FL=1
MKSSKENLRSLICKAFKPLKPQKAFKISTRKNQNSNSKASNSKSTITAKTKESKTVQIAQKQLQKSYSARRYDFITTTILQNQLNQ